MHKPSLAELSDEALVERCLAKEASAWDEMVRRHKRRVFNIAYQFVGRYDIAEDLTQDLFLKIYHALAGFETERNFAAWLTRITRNLCIDHYRRRQRERELNRATDNELRTVESPRRDAYAVLRSHEKAAFLKRGLEELSPDLRTAVVMRDIGGHSYQEIADKLGIPEGTVKSRINRGRIELARILKERDASENVMGTGEREVAKKRR